MKLNKNSFKSDQVANLYRAAFYLASGNQRLAVDFLNRSQFKDFNRELNQPLSKSRRLYLSEKILDQYHRVLTA